MVRSLQNKYNEFKAISEKMDKIESAMMEDFENEELENEFDNYYTNVYFPKHEELVKAIATITNCEIKVARSILASDKFESLMGFTIA